MRGPTRRQWACERLLAEGMSNRQIADRLGIGLPTVRGLLYGHDQRDGRHFPGLFERIGATNRSQAASWYWLGGKDWQPAQEVSM